MPATIQTIGHSNHSADHFLQLLKSHQIEVVVDTRSQPYSNYATHFDQAPLKQSLATNGLQYLYLGRELGGRPEGNEYYDAKGHVLYHRVAESELFLQGLARLESGMQKFRIALLCAEENPAHCHRRLLISRVLIERGIRVDHIRGDGRLQSESDLALENGEQTSQGSLFQGPERQEWKSIASVLLKKRQSNSSGS
jgi:uncharacterized protein (DUF488 family)